MATNAMLPATSRSAKASIPSCLGGTYLDPVTAKFQALMPLPTNTNSATGFQDFTNSYSNSRLLRYGSGLPITSPTSVSQLNTLLSGSSAGGRNTFYNRVSGQPLYTQDINCKCFNPSQTLVLNPLAWHPGAGKWGTAAARCADYSGARRPSENISLGRIFRMTEIGSRSKFIPS